MYIDPKLSVIRQRAVGLGFHEELTILSHSAEPADLTIRIEAAADFADLFEVKDALPKLGTYDTRVDGGSLVLGYQRETFRRETTISASEPATVDEHGLTFTVRVEPHGSWTTDLNVVTSLGGLGRRITETKYGRSNRKANPDMAQSLEDWIGEAPHLECDWEPLKATYHRSLVDLAALRFSPLIAGGRSLPAAGLPWFMTMFGRDSIFTSLQALPFAPELAGTTLRVLGEWQGTRLDDFRDEDPGRILHEMRYGEMAAFEGAHTPLLRRRRRDAAVRDPARRVRALDGRQGAGQGPRGRSARGDQLDRPVRRPDGQRLHLVQAAERPDRPREPELEGLLKLDLRYRADGRLPDFPRATCELQGYAYDAKVSNT